MEGHGFIPDVIRNDNYIFGSGQLKSPVIQDDGNWSEYIPVPEYQRKNGLETMNCTVYGTLNAIETLSHKKYSHIANYSERFTGVLAETTLYGNTPHKVAEVIRHEGLVPEHELPFDDSIKKWEEYYSPSPMTARLKRMAKKWLESWEFKHDWVPMGDTLTNNQINMMDALRYSPLGVAVNAWHKIGDIHVKRGTDNHWCMIYAAAPGNYWYVLDHYDQTTKLVDWDYPFEFVKRYSLKKRVRTVGWFNKIIEWLKSLYGR